MLLNKIKDGVNFYFYGYMDYFSVEYIDWSKGVPFK